MNGRTGRRLSKWGVFRDPAFIARRGLEAAVSDMARTVGTGARVLVDVGCGSKPYEAMFDVGRYVGIDVAESGHPSDAKRCDLLFDGRTLPFADGEVDVVLCTQVLEHAEDHRALLREVARVLGPGGYLLLTVPFVWEEHELPYDFRRFTAEGTVRDLRDAGLRALDVRKTAGSFETVAQVASVSVHRGLGRGVPYWSAVVSALLCAPIQIGGMVLQAIIPEGRELYLDVAVVATKALEEAEADRA